MRELLVDAVPAFVLLLVLEALAFRFLGDDGPEGERLLGFARRDTTANIALGLGSLVVGAAYKALLAATYAALYALTPLRVPMQAWWAWALLVPLDDLAYYWYHRTSHVVRLFWASHVVHHSSGRYNYSTAVRQPWTPITTLPFWLVLPLLGFPVWAVLTQQSINLIYQFWIHTERVGRLWAPLELVLNTPSHHRVHHGSNRQYLDKNYGGILIVWDRLFGTFAPERERVVYGLTKPVTSHNPLVLAFHEWGALSRDLRRARGWRERAGFVLGRPGWQPSA